MSPDAQAPRTIPLTPFRRAKARNLVTSWNTIPMASYNSRVDMGAILSLRDKLLAQGKKVMPGDILIKIIATALKDFPQLNASLEDDALSFSHSVNLGVAVSIGDGVIYPIVRQAETLAPDAIAEELKSLTKRARSGSLTLEEFTGASFSVCDLGSLGVESFSLIVPQGQCATIGMGAIVKTPVEQENRITMVPLMNLCLCVDGRAVDPSTAGLFLSKIKDLARAAEGIIPHS